ncbi:TetR/AcrR family transcriptional regulator [Neisseriaceae bacterium CLB008]|nr:TetR family transcriptional regulator [Neisseriaceae bacterium]
MLRAQQRAAVKNQIYEQAMALFVAHGFEAVTVQQITDACGIAKGTFFNYFARKDDVLRHYGHAQQSLMLPEWETLSQYGSIKNQITHLLVLSLRRFTALGPLMATVVRAFMETTESAQNENVLIMSFAAQLAELIEDAKKAGTLRSRFESHKIADAVVASYFYLGVSHTFEKQSYAELEGRLRAQIELIWQAVEETEA